MIEMQEKFNYRRAALLEVSESTGASITRGQEIIHLNFTDTCTSRILRLSMSEDDARSLVHHLQGSIEHLTTLRAGMQLPDEPVGPGKQGIIPRTSTAYERRHTMKIDDHLWEKMCDATICGHEYARRESVEATLATVPEPGVLTELLEALIDLRLHYAEEICIPVEHCTGEYFRKSNEAIAKATDAPQQTSDASAPPADRSMAK